MARLKAQDTSTEGTISSMRRLSSLASLHSLLSFSKSRRTAADTEDSITSDTDTASATPSRILQETSHNVRPQPAAFGGFVKKNQANNTAALPRSKTFSSLPLPVKSKKRTSAAGGSATHASRLATPTSSGRRYLLFSGNKSLQRSDTEPLLLAPGNEENTPPPSKDSAQRGHEHAQEWNLTRQSGFSGIVPRSTPRLKSKACQRLPDLPKQWQSQPNLLSLTSRVPTPPPNTLPVFAFETPSRLESLVEITPEISKVRAVTEAQPASYWAARLSAILDRAKTRDLSAHFEEKRTTLRTDTDALTNKMYKLAYTREAMVELYSHCTTTEARNSFTTFQMQYAALTNQPRLTMPIGEDINAAAVSAVVSQRPERDRNSSGRKVSFVDKLLDRVRKHGKH